MLDFHPSARDNFNAKAEALLKLLREIPRHLSAHGSYFPLDVPIKEISADSIVGDIEEGSSDYQGRITRRWFTNNGIQIGLEQSEYTELSALAESIQSLPKIREKLSQEFIERVLFSWLKEKYLTKKQDDPFVSHLELIAAEQVRPIVAYVPIAETIVEEPFEFCWATITNISKEFIDKIESRPKFTSDDDKESHRKWIEMFREKYQGYASIKMTLECEPKHAAIISREKAKIITELLGIYSDAVLFPSARCFSKIKGTENIEQYSLLLDIDDKKIQYKNEITENFSMYMPYIISVDILDQYSRLELSVLSNIVTKDKPSEFEKTVLTMAMLYSKAAFTADPMAKLVYILSALESTLLKNESEPIQQNLAERMAFFITNEIEKRKDIIKNVKYVYALRSKYLHHGHSSEEIEQLSKFFMNVFELFVKMLKVSGIFKDKNEFINKIDDIKLS